MCNWVRLVGVACVLTGSVALAEDAKPGDKPVTDASFAKHAAADNMMEIDLGKIAETNAADPEVKAFGAKMVADHTKANAKLMDIAKEMNVMLPEKVNAKHQKHLDAMMAMKGADFDKHYISHMVKDHEKDIAMLTKASGELKDAKLKEWVEMTLPVMKSHLAMAKKIHDRMEK